MMGFPVIPFKLCDFWAINNEVWNGDTLTVSGMLPGRTAAVATFKRQSTTKGSWLALSLLPGKC
jgi:hypothetical protein